MEDKDVIQVNNDMAIINEVAEDFLHDSLESSWGIAETECHNEGFIEAEFGFEGSFPFFSFFNADTIVSPSNIEFHEVSCRT